MQVSVNFVELGTEHKLVSLSRDRLPCTLQKGTSSNAQSRAVCELRPNAAAQNKYTTQDYIPATPRNITELQGARQSAPKQSAQAGNRREYLCKQCNRMHRSTVKPAAVCNKQVQAGCIVCRSALTSCPVSFSFARTTEPKAPRPSIFIMSYFSSPCPN